MLGRVARHWMAACLFLLYSSHLLGTTVSVTISGQHNHLFPPHICHLRKGGGGGIQIETNFVQARDVDPDPHPEEPYTSGPFGSASWSVRQRYGSEDPDPHQYVMGPQHWFKHTPQILYNTAYHIPYCTSKMQCAINHFPLDEAAKLLY